MKPFFLTLLLFSINAFASLDCLSTDKQGYRLIVVDKDAPQAILTVRYKGQTVYEKLVTGERGLGTRFTYTSAPFTNENDAPAQLYLEVFNAYTQIQGHFQEGAYLPVVPYMQLVCKPF